VMRAQTSQDASQPITFEVASVKENKTTTAPQGARVLPSGQVTITNVAVRALIRSAWDSEAIQLPSQIVGGPSWVDTDHCDINAKASLSSASRRWRGRFLRNAFR
jgi:uncharacterized protein (TIGR03435 family)